MIKYTVIFVASLMLFFGCGEDTSEQVTNTEENLSTIERTLINSGFEDASDVVEIGEDTIAFTYDNNGNKNFTIYDNENGKVLAYITSFLGDSLVTQEITNNTITYANGMTVTVVDYTSPQMQATATSLQIVMERFGETLQSFTYSPQKDAAFVVTKDSSGTKLSVYGLEDIQNPTFEYHIVKESSEQVFIKNVKALDNGRISYEIINHAAPSPYNQYHTIVYNYVNKYQISDIVSSSENTSLTSRDIIQRQITENGENALVELFAFSPSKYGAIVVISTAEGRSIYLYGLEDPQNPLREYAIFESAADEVITNITMLGGGQFQYMYYNKASLPRQYVKVVYNYVGKYEVSSTLNQNPVIRVDPEEYIRDYYLDDNDTSTEVQSFEYSSDNESDAIVVVSNADSYSLYLYEIPYNHVNPYIDRIIKPLDPKDEWTNVYDIRKIGAGRVSFIGTTKNSETKTYVYYFREDRYDNASPAASMEELIRAKMQNDGGYVRDYIEYYTVDRTVITSKKPDEKWEISVYDTSDDSVAQWSYTIGNYGEISDLSKYSSTVIKFTADGTPMVYDVLSGTFISN